MIENLQTWLEQNESLVAWAVGFSIVTFLGSIVFVPMAVIQMRKDYFIKTSTPKMPRTPWQILRRIGKNVLGVAILLIGLAMLVLPGQGLLAILLGLSLVDFPGKRSLQLRLLRLKGFRRSVDWIRRKADKPPLDIP